MSDALVAESGSETDTSHNGDISEEDSPDEPLDCPVSALDIHSS